MKKRTKISVALLLVLSLLLSACAAGVAQEDYDAVVAVRDAARAQVASLQAEVADLEAEHDEAHELIEVMQATAKYHDVKVAEADGYAAASPCVQAPPGGMGIHYVNPGLFEKPVDPLTPAILLYLPTETGVKLIGVEYGAVALAATAEGPAPWFKEEAPGSWITSAPTILGQTFEGPMAAHGPEEPWHYDLHVWLWEENPSGLFADFNPTVHCPE